MKHFRHRELVFAALLSASTLFAVGCGSDDDNRFNGTTVLPIATATTTTTTVNYNGRYVGSTTLSNGQPAAYDLTVSGSNQIGGTITLGSVSARSDFAPTQGTYSVSGFVDPASGAFSLSNNQGLQVSGVLPSNGRAGSITVTINGETFTAALDPASFSPSGSATGGSTTTTTTTNGSTSGSTTSNGTPDPISGVVLSGFSFNPSGDYNGPVATSNPLITSGFFDNRETGTKGQFAIALTVGFSGTNVQGLVFGAQTTGEALAVGQEFPVITTAEAGNNPGSYVSMSDSTGTTINKAWAQNTGTTGSVKITSLSATRIEVDFTFNNVPINTAVANNAATGTFSVSGHAAGSITPN